MLWEYIYRDKDVNHTTYADREKCLSCYATKAIVLRLAEYAMLDIAKSSYVVKSIWQNNAGHTIEIIAKEVGR